MTYRERSRTTGVTTSGGLKAIFCWGGQSPYLLPTSYPRKVEFMADHTDPQPYPDHGLYYMRKERLSSLTVDGQTPQWDIICRKHVYSHFIPLFAGDAESLPLPEGNAALGYLITRALANLNPSVPNVDLPLFFFEFKDFPRMIKNAGDILSGLRHVSKGINPLHANDGFLAWQYGWAPLISDLWKLVQVASALENRKRFFAKARAGTRVARRLGSTSKSVDAGSYSYHLTDDCVFDVNYQSTDEWSYWFTAHVQVEGGFSVPPPTEMAHIRAMFGLNVSAATLWNALPWSFLIDYFANVGDMLSAARGYMPIVTTNMCVMSHGIRSRSEIPQSSPPGFTTHGGVSKTEVKLRSVIANPTPSLAWKPILSGRQQANMASLALAQAFR